MKSVSLTMRIAAPLSTSFSADFCFVDFSPPPSSGEPSPKELRSAAKSAGDSLFRQTASYNNAIKGAEEAEKLAGMAKTNPRAAGALLGKLARAAGEVGVLSDSDISRLGGSQAISERLERWVGLSTSPQKITDDDIRSAQELAKAMKETATAQKRSVVDDSVARFSTNYKVDQATAHKLLTGQDLEAPAPQAGTVIVVKGNERLEIPADDLKDAMADGYTQE
jgi:hypothetical protein